MQSCLFMRCSIFKAGSDLNIKIYKESRQRKIITLRQASEGDLLGRANIKFNDLWRHLVSESQKETKCELIFASVASDMLRILQKTLQWNLLMQFQDFSSTLLLRYAFDHYQYVYPLSRCDCRPTAVIYGPWMHISGVLWSS